jgi:hypothetical protein
VRAGSQGEQTSDRQQELHDGSPSAQGCSLALKGDGGKRIG